MDATFLGNPAMENFVPEPLYCRLDGLTAATRTQRRLQTLQQLQLLDTEAVPILDEATQTAARFLNMPICYLGLIVNDEILLKSALGLSRLGFMNTLASQRKYPKDDSLCTHVIDSQQPLVVEDTWQSRVFERTPMVQQYDIRAYVGIPLLSSEQECLGTLSLFDRQPRVFSSKDIEFLVLVARWCLREYERDLLLETQSTSPSSAHHQTAHHDPIDYVPATEPEVTITREIKLRLLEQLSQKLKTPLTSIIGMASVLNREVYGTLAPKQKEYLGVIHNSGQHMLSLVEEIVNLNIFSETEDLTYSPTDLEMLCQQAINSLFEVAKERQQTLRLSIEPGERIWWVDKVKVRQSLYYLLSSILSASEAGGEVRIHVSRRPQSLNIAIWVSHPWLGDGLNQANPEPGSVPYVLSTCLARPLSGTGQFSNGNSSGQNQVLEPTLLAAAIEAADQRQDKTAEKYARELLGLLLCCHLIESHRGKIIVQGTVKSGYRYVMMLPKVAVPSSASPTEASMETSISR
ncbi:MAG: GAF domain-containing sensor histidine kinase [Cyanobacteria bacterium P01_H01_bin.15]